LKAQVETNRIEEIVGHPVFLVGALRSGTTLLRLMLASHPSISWIPEFDYAVDMIPRDRGWPDLDEYHSWLLTHRIFRAHGFQFDRHLQYPALVSGFLRQRLLRKSSARLVGATIHRSLDALPRLWPAARFIHLVRDPRDVAVSCINMGWSGNAWMGVLPWRDTEQSWNRLQTGLAPGTWIEVRFEDLVRSPEGELGRICEFIGIPYDPAMLAYSAQSSYELPDPRSAGKWQRLPRRKDVRLVEARVWNLMRARGYLPSTPRPLRVTAAQDLAYRLHSKIRCSQFRAKRYGLRLVFLDFIGRRFGLASLEGRVRLRMAEIEQLYLK
jgi:hypothetical protein